MNKLKEKFENININSDIIEIINYDLNIVAVHINNNNRFPFPLYCNSLLKELLFKKEIIFNINKLKTDRRYRSNAVNYLKNFSYFTKHCKK